MNPLITKGVSALGESGVLHSARVHWQDKQGKRIWLLWINGRPIAEADSHLECQALLAAVLLSGTHQESIT